LPVAKSLVRFRVSSCKGLYMRTSAESSILLPYEEHGYEGLRDRRRRRVSEKRVALKQVEEVLRLYQEQYFDFNVRHFHEKLVADHGIKLSYTWVKLALQGAGLVKKGRKRGVHRKRRPRRPLP